jgi:hypothetical protein
MFDIPAANPQRSLTELRGQIWMVIGIIMLIVGLHLHGLEGSSEVYKITSDQITNISDQLANGNHEISLTLYYEILTTNYSTNSLRVTTVNSDDLMLE